MFPSDVMPRIYAGWLGKLAGIRLGANIEGWTYQKIAETYGELTGYPVAFRNFAADDDSNGPLFFLRALEDKRADVLTSQDVGDALLNYAPYEHGFFWWGGYGTSTEHTAYLNLRAGVKAPKSGSIELNGAAVAEQIGGQIFIDTWGLVAPGNPRLAAKMAKEAASVTHGGNGVYGGMFVAACVSAAFTETDIEGVLRAGLSVIPDDCEYAGVVRAVWDFYRHHPDDWRMCFAYIYSNFGYDRYPGACHIIPNAAVMILSMLYGRGDFGRTICICAMCGWDTDCNAGNVGAIAGVLYGIDGIDTETWLRPIGDLLICSSVIGSLNIMDAPYGASYIARLAHQLAGISAPEYWAELFEKRIDDCHFEYPKSTHALRIQGDAAMENTDEAARTGARSLKITGKDDVRIYKQTHYTPGDFDDSRYDPCFSPLLYPGQTVRGSILSEMHIDACLYIKEQRTQEIILGETVALAPGEWADLSLKIPAMDGALISEAGYILTGDGGWIAYIDDFGFGGDPEYSIDFAKETTEKWTFGHREVSQFTRLKGQLYLENQRLHLTSADFAEAYTGRHDFANLTLEARITPVTGAHMAVNFRVQGALRSYAFGFHGEGKLALLKNDNGYSVLAEVEYDWRPGAEHTLFVRAEGDDIWCACGNAVITFRDEERPYRTGSIGLSARSGSHLACAGMRIGKDDQS